MFGVQKWKNSSKGGITVSVKIWKAVWKAVMILAILVVLSACGHDIAVRQANDKKRIAERAKQELSDIELQF